MFEGLPRVVRVGGFDVKIEIREISADRGRTCFGEYCHEEMTILLSPKQPGLTFAADTVMHELGHAIYADRDLRVRDSEERIIGQLSRGYTQTFRDNPELLKWLTKSLAP